MNTKEYKALCQAPFENGYYFQMLVFTGSNDEEGLPVFRTVLAESPLKVEVNGKSLWGISGYNAETGESQWYAYNDCVSLENFGVLKRLLGKRYAWMQLVDGLREETLLLAKAQLYGEQGAKEGGTR